MLAQRILQLYNSHELDATLPTGFTHMDPYKGQHAEVIARVSHQFYTKFYADEQPRTLILGINPGRLGAGLTGIPFTDTKRLNVDCGIALPEFNSHEPSSVFVYKLIQAMGGPEAFYSQFLISSVCPLGFLLTKPNGQQVNANYYDSPALFNAVRPFIIQSLKRHVALGVRNDRVFCLGTGKNFACLSKLNTELGLFNEVIALEHPRFVMQYRAAQLDAFVAGHAKKLGGG